MSFQDRDQPDKRIALGRIASAHGVKGLVKILPYGDDAGLLEQALDYKITLKNPQGQYILAEIHGVNDREAAEALKGTELFIARDRLPKIEDDDSYYIEDLVGLNAVDGADTAIGKVLAVHNFGAGNLLEISTRMKGSFMIPFSDETVPDVDLQNGLVRLLNYEMYMD